jgi:hypothetical protein
MLRKRRTEQILIGTQVGFAKKKHKQNWIYVLKENALISDFEIMFHFPFDPDPNKAQMISGSPPVTIPDQVHSKHNRKSPLFSGKGM